VSYDEAGAELGGFESKLSALVLSKYIKGLESSSTIPCSRNIRSRTPSEPMKT
jgi:hypothetical protein